MPNDPCELSRYLGGRTQVQLRLERENHTSSNRALLFQPLLRMIPGTLVSVRDMKHLPSIDGVLNLVTVLFGGSTRQSMVAPNRVGQKRIFRLTGTVGYDVSPTRVPAHLNCFHRRGDRTDLIELDEQGIGRLLLDAMGNEP